MTDHVTASFILEYNYRRSTGAVIGRFLQGLRSGRIEAARTQSGQMLVPPLEYDPYTGEETKEMLAVGPGGVIKTWGWVEHPLPSHPLSRPFAFALIRLDGADSDLLHIVSAQGKENIKTGMRVAPQWRANRIGSILDIEYFVAEQESQDIVLTENELKDEKVTDLYCPVRLEYHLTSGTARSRFLKCLQEGKLFGTRCSDTGKVYFPPRSFSPISGKPMEEEVPLPDSGIVTSFCIIRFEFEGQILKPPYACAYILLDGADVPFLHLVDSKNVDEMRMGMHVSAVWRPQQEWRATMENIRYFQPDGQPDAAFDSYKEHL